MQRALLIAVICCMPVPALAECNIDEAYRGTWQVQIEGQLAQQVKLLRLALAQPGADIDSKLSALSEQEAQTVRSLAARAAEPDARAALEQRLKDLASMTITITANTVTTELGDETQTQTCTDKSRRGDRVVLTLTESETVDRIELRLDEKSLFITDGSDVIRCEKPVTD